MAFIYNDNAQKAARNMLLESIRREWRSGSVSTTEEMAAYLLNGAKIATRYESRHNGHNPAQRRLAAPEFVSGLLTDTSA